MDTKAAPEFDAVGLHAIHHAARLGDMQALAQLLNQGVVSVDLPTKRYGARTPLMFAVQQGQLAAVKLLLEHKASVEATDTDGQTALCFTSELEFAELLLDAKANINHAGHRLSTVLMDAVDNQARVKFLLQRKANVALRNKDNRTALDLARLFKYASVVALLEAAERDQASASATSSSATASSSDAARVEALVSQQMQRVMGAAAAIHDAVISSSSASSTTPAPVPARDSNSAAAAEAEAERQRLAQAKAEQERKLAEERERQLAAKLAELAGFEEQLEKQQLDLDALKKKHHELEVEVKSLERKRARLLRLRQQQLAKPGQFP